MTSIATSSRHFPQNTPHFLPVWSHPEAVAGSRRWAKCRDAYAGQDVIHSKGEIYIPRGEATTVKEFWAMIKRTPWRNFSAKTIDGLTGSLMAEPPTAEGLPAKLSPGLDQIGVNGESLTQIVNSTAAEVFTVGRAAVSVDLAGDGRGAPYLVLWDAESVLDWRSEKDPESGRNILNEVLLREWRTERKPGAPSVTLASYRRYFLEFDPTFDRKVVKVALYSNPDSHGDITQDPTSLVTLSNRGRPFTRIPIEFFSADGNTPNVAKPPLWDLVTLNFVLYRLDSEYHTGLFYAGQPQFYVKLGAGTETGTYVLGASKLWEVPIDAQPGILEFHGQGLGQLRNAQDDLVQDISSMGARAMGVKPAAVAENETIFLTKQKNETSLLNEVANSLDTGFSRLLRVWASWQDVDDSSLPAIGLKISRSYQWVSAGAREISALHRMWKDGALPIETIFSYARRGGIIESTVTLPQFKRLLEARREEIQADAAAAAE